MIKQGSKVRGGDPASSARQAASPSNRIAPIVIKSLLQPYDLML
jgi:hypothetical protein